MKQYNRFRMVNRNREYITLGELAKVIAGKVEELLVCIPIMTTEAVAYKILQSTAFCRTPFSVSTRFCSTPVRISLWKTCGWSIWSKYVQGHISQRLRFESSIRLNGS